MVDDGEFDYGSLDDSDQREFLYDVIGFKEPAQDEEAHYWFYNAFYNDDMRMDERLQMMDELSTYLFDVYGVDFEALWDWDDFREWYASA